MTMTDALFRSKIIWESFHMLSALGQKYSQHLKTQWFYIKYRADG